LELHRGNSHIRNYFAVGINGNNTELLLISAVSVGGNNSNNSELHRGNSHLRNYFAIGINDNNRGTAGIRRTRRQLKPLELFIILAVVSVVTTVTPPASAVQGDNSGLWNY